MKPAGALLAEDIVPINIAGLELRCGGVAAVGAAERAAHAEAALGKVQAVAHGAAHAVVVEPFDELVHTALVDEVLNEASNGVFGERGDDSRLEPEAALEAARHVVLA